MSPAFTGRETVNVVGPAASVSAALVPAPVNRPPPAGRSTRSSTWFPALPELTEKLVTVPSNGTWSAGAATPLNGAYVQLMPATQMFAVGFPVVLPSVTVCAVVAAPAVASGPPAEAMATAAARPPHRLSAATRSPMVGSARSQAYRRAESFSSPAVWRW